MLTQLLDTYDLYDSPPRLYLNHAQDPAGPMFKFAKHVCSYPNVLVLLRPHMSPDLTWGVHHEEPGLWPEYLASQPRDSPDKVTVKLQMRRVLLNRKISPIKLFITTAAMNS